jgi:hypothetical protein
MDPRICLGSKHMADAREGMDKRLPSCGKKVFAMATQETL